MFELIAGLFEAIQEARDEARLQRSVGRAYTSAWRTREATGDSAIEVLDGALTAEGAQRTSDSHAGPDVRAALRAWSDGLPPREAREKIRSASH